MKTRSKEYGSANVVGKSIERLRLAKGIKQSDFIARLQAAGLDINPTSYSKLEGQLRQANDLEIYYISKLLNVSIESLFIDYENNKDNAKSATRPFQFDSKRSRCLFKCKILRRFVYITRLIQRC